MFFYPLLTISKNYCCVERGGSRRDDYMGMGTRDGYAGVSYELAAILHRVIYLLLTKRGRETELRNKPNHWNLAP